MHTSRLHLSSALAAVALMGTTGCYTYSAYVPDRPAPGSAVEVTLNDRGRVAQAQSLGPEVWQVEGSVVSVTDSAFELRVTRTLTLDRTAIRWTGESVTLRLEDVRGMRERRFSRGRTAILASTLTASTIAFFATRGLFGLGNEGSDPTGPGDGDNDN
jgi:hypothetical protein